MTDKRISELVDAGALAGTEQIPVNDGGTTRRTTVAAIAALGGGAPAGVAGGVLNGTYPDPSFAVDMATQAELDAHTADTSAAHAASAVSFASFGTITSADVQAAIQELDGEYKATDILIFGAVADHIADTADAHDATAISFAPAAGIAATDVQAAIVEDAGDLAAHLADTSAAHTASAIAFTSNGSIAATDVQAAIQEVRDEAGSGAALTVEEVDASPTDSAVTKIVFPNGTLSIVGHVVTYTPSGSGVTAAQLGGINLALWSRCI